MSETLIQVNQLTKKYFIKRTINARFRTVKVESPYLEAISNITFNVKKGEIIGIIGHNGAGKSTLLRLIANIAAATSGDVVLRGTVRCLLNISAGLIDNLTGFDNIYYISQLYGIDKSSIDVEVDNIIEFSELTEAIHEKVRTYSTGMKVRLAFSIAFSFSADIFLIDEVLAVGDEFFSNKSREKIKSVVESSATCLIVSHDWSNIFMLASRVLWLEKGKIIMDGTPSEIMFQYFRSLNKYEITHEAKIESVQLMSSDNYVSEIMSGDSLSIKILYRTAINVQNIAVIIGFTSIKNGQSVVSSWSLDDNFVVEPQSDDSAMINISYDSLPLIHGKYDVCVYLVNPCFGPFPSECLDIYGGVVSQDRSITLSVVSEASNALLSGKVFDCVFQKKCRELV